MFLGEVGPETFNSVFLEHSLTSSWHRSKGLTRGKNDHVLGSTLTHSHPPLSRWVPEKNYSKMYVWFPLHP